MKDKLCHLKNCNLGKQNNQAPLTSWKQPETLVQLENSNLTQHPGFATTHRHVTTEQHEKNLILN